MLGFSWIPWRVVVLSGVLLGALAASAGASTAPGQVLGFGHNRFGQLGRHPDQDTPNLPAVLHLPAGSGRVVSTAGGAAFSLVATSSGRLYAFGENRAGQLGESTNAGTSKPNPTPRQVNLPGLEGHVVQVAAGYEHSLVLTSAGQLYGFGSNFFGELGNSAHMGTDTPNPKPSLITLPGASGPPVQIAAGYETSFAVTSAGELYGWGDGNYGQLGTGSTSGPNPTPTRALINGSPMGVASVSAGEDHTLVVMKSGALFAFGDNLNGELGTATHAGVDSANPVPFRVPLPSGSGRVIQAAAGASSSLALTRSGAVYAWGDNSWGELCNTVNYNKTTPNPVPRRVALGHIRGRIVHIQVNDVTSLMLASTGKLSGCGSDAYDQLGLPRPASWSFPRVVSAQLAAGTTIDAVSRGMMADHTLATVANLAVITRSLTAGTAGTSYHATVHAQGGTAPYRWSARGLPHGLGIGATTGKLSGKPAKAGRYGVTVTVTDADGIAATRHLTLVVAS